MCFLKGKSPIPPVVTGEFPLTPSLSTLDLPDSYLKLLEKQNGGYTQYVQVQTEEPTSDGLDYAHIHYIWGIHDQPTLSILSQQNIPSRETLPDYLVIFSAHEEQLFTFDYSQCSNKKEPAIRYIDLETGNWQTVAPTFETFINHLKPGEIFLPLEGNLTTIQAEHALLLTTDPVMLNGLWMHLEDCTDKEWYFSWLLYFSGNADRGIRQATIDALEMQILYYRLSLPKNTQEVFDIFLNDQEDSIRNQAVWLLKEWNEVN